MGIGACSVGSNLSVSPSKLLSQKTSMTNPTPLSPAAQAVLDAYRDAAIADEATAAAVLRAAADQVVPEKLESYGIRYELLRIAGELEQLGD